jgi:hypothetical protein
LEVEFWQEVQLEREMTIIQRLMDEGNCPQRHNTQHIDIPNNDIQHNDTQHKGLICDSQHK